MKINQCKDFMNSVLKQNKVRLKDISCTFCGNVYCCDGLGFYKEIKSHCKYCAIAEYVFKGVEE